MFLTTETSLAETNYERLHILHGTGGLFGGVNLLPLEQIEAATENALDALYKKAVDCHADGVIGVHINTAIHAYGISVTAIGTAIKYF